MVATSTEPEATASAPAERPPAPLPELFPGSVDELVCALRIEAWRAHGRWAPFRVQGDFIAAMKVRPDFRRELVAKAAREPDGFLAFAQQLREAATVRARSNGGWSDPQTIKRADDGTPTLLRWIELYEYEVRPGVALCVECSRETDWKGGIDRPRCWQCVQRGVHND